MSEIKEKRWNGRKVISEIIFPSEGRPFSAFYEAKDALLDGFYKCGSLDVDNPVGVMRYEYSVPQKWSKITAMDKKRLNGVMISDDFRNGSVKVLIFE